MYLKHLTENQSFYSTMQENNGNGRRGWVVVTVNENENEMTIASTNKI